LFAISPLEIQFLAAPSLGVFSTKLSLLGSNVATVSTTIPELTPARRSVRPKQPMSPRA
jgi:hypothetical protein